MIKYTSHVAFCAILAAVTSWFPATSHQEGAIFLHAMLWWCCGCTLLAAVLDLTYVGYSSMANLWPRNFDAGAVVICALMVVINTVVCVGVETVFLRGVIGFQFELELAFAIILHVRYIVEGIHWDLTATQEAYDFYEAQGLDLRKHMWWSFPLSGPGTAVRCYKRLMVHMLSVWIFPDESAFAVDLSPAAYWVAFAVLSWAGFQNMPGCLQYTWLHRWAHDTPIIYLLVHKIHHIARYPIPSDSGTESPLEFWLDEVNFGAVGMPLPAFAALEWMMGAVQYRNHNFAAEGPAGLHHRLHHSVNTGNCSLPEWDAADGLDIKQAGLPKKAFGLMKMPIDGDVKESVSSEPAARAARKIV